MFMPRKNMQLFVEKYSLTILFTETLKYFKNICENFQPQNALWGDIGICGLQEFNIAYLFTKYRIQTMNKKVDIVIELS